MNVIQQFLQLLEQSKKDKEKPSKSNKKGGKKQ